MVRVTRGSAGGGEFAKRGGLCHNGRSLAWELVLMLRPETGSWQVKDRQGRGWCRQSGQYVQRSQGRKELGEFDPGLCPDRGDCLWESPAVERGLILPHPRPTAPQAGTAPTVARVAKSQGEVSSRKADLELVSGTWELME